MKLLHIDSSALGAYSVSRGLTAAVVAEFVAAHPGVAVTYRDLHADALPHWTPPAGENDPQAVANTQVLEEFLAADVIVLGAPMYNFGIASTLKAWIDRITVAGRTFRYTSEGPEGLAGGKRVIIASSRGGVYAGGAPAAGLDFQEPYLRAILGFLGIRDIDVVRAEGMAKDEAYRSQSIEKAMAGIEDVVREAA